MLCLEIWREGRGEGRRVKENSYPPPCLDVFNLSKGKGNN